MSSHGRAGGSALFLGNAVLRASTRADIPVPDKRREDGV